MGEKTPAQLAIELKAAQSLIGKKTIGIPGPTSTPEEQRAYHTARGVPEAPDGYKLDDVLAEIEKEFPGIERDAAREKQFREFARASNLSQTEAAELVSRQLRAEIAANAEGIKAAQTANTATKTLIDENWGPKAEAKNVAATRGARHIGLDDAATEVFMKAAGTNPEARFKLVDALATLGEMLGEGGGPGTQPGGGQLTMTADQARVAGQQFLDQGDNREAYMNPAHDRHKAVEAEYTKYARIAQGRT